jgi:predicted enzyme related to lactoylglutathione lyase
MSFRPALGLKSCNGKSKGDEMSELNIHEVGRVTVPSADQDKALEFYVDTLGFEKTVDETFAGGQMRWIEVVPPGGKTAIALTPPMGEFQPGRQTGIIISTSDVEADHRALKDAGVDVDSEVQDMGPPVPPMFAVRDPEGNELTVVQPLDR